MLSKKKTIVGKEEKDLPPPGEQLIERKGSNESFQYSDKESKDHIDLSDEDEEEKDDVLSEEEMNIQ